MKPILFIDITDPAYLVLALGKRKNGGNWLIEQGKIRRRGRLNLLIQLDKFLRLHRLSVKKLSALVLLEGGGTFSEVRLAAAILNTIYLDTGLPVLGLDRRSLAGGWQDIAVRAARALVHRPRAPIKPLYTGEPNITTSTVKL